MISELQFLAVGAFLVCVFRRSPQTYCFRSRYPIAGVVSVDASRGDLEQDVWSETRA